MRLLLVLAVLIVGAVPTGAQASTWIAPRDVQAVAEPGAAQAVFPVRGGERYRLLKRGGPGKRWCKLAGPQGRAGWVECAPGEATTHVQEATGCARTCPREPLFSRPPPLSAADREVLAMCPARPDAAVAEGDVRRFVAAHVDDPRLQRALSVAGRTGSREENVDFLTRLWTGRGPRNAFTHVFCGDDWTREKVGGLHWLPRYAQLEREGKVCFGGPVRRGQPLVGDQYLIRFHGAAPWSCASKPVGGFPRSVDPVELMAIGTRAFVHCCARGRQGGVYAAPDLGGTAWRVHCGTRDGTFGIDTLYPTDDRPSCR